MFTNGVIHLLLLSQSVRLDIDNSVHKQARAEAEMTMKELTSLAQHTSVSFYPLILSFACQFEMLFLLHTLGFLHAFID